MERASRNAVRAPSAGFSQGWDFVVLADRRRARGVLECHDDRRTAPDDPWLGGMRARAGARALPVDKDAYLDRYAEPDKGWTDRDEARWPVPYWDVDTGMAALLILLTAVDEGLGGCFFGVPPSATTPSDEALRHPRGPHARRAWCRWGMPCRGPGARACVGTVASRHEVAHWGRFGVAR